MSLKGYSFEVKLVSVFNPHLGPLLKFRIVCSNYLNPMCKADRCEETNGSRFDQTRSSDDGIPR